MPDNCEKETIQSKYDRIREIVCKEAEEHLKAEIQRLNGMNATIRRQLDDTLARLSSCNAENESLKALANRLSEEQSTMKEAIRKAHAGLAPLVLLASSLE